MKLSQTFVPILSLVISALGLVLSSIALVFVILGVAEVSLAFLLPFALFFLIFSLFVSGVAGVLNFMFLKSKFCAAGLIIACVSICIIIGSFITMYTL